MRPALFLHVKTVVGVVVACLTLSAMYWRNALEISRLREEMHTVQVRLDHADQQARDLLIRTVLLEDKIKRENR